MTRLRHELAAYSPISLLDCIAASAAALRLRADPRPRLVELLKREYAADDVVLCGSGTQALQLAIGEASKRISVAPIVSLPAYTCYDVASAAIGAGFPITLYDVDAETFGPSLESLERTLIDGANIIVIAPSYGIPVDWSAITTLADRYGAAIVEDAAQGHGASWRGQKLGTLGGVSVLSFGRGKGWTGGNGGAVLIRGKKRQIDLPHEQTFTSDVKTAIALYAQWLLGRPRLYAIPRSIPSLNLGVTVYHPPRQPRAMTRSAAAAALSDFESAIEESTQRRARAAMYTETLMNVPTGKLPRVLPETRPGYLRFPVLLRSGASFAATRENERDELRDDVRELGVERGYPMSIGRLPQVMQRTVGSVRQWPGADRIVAEVVTLPTHSRMSVDGLRKVVKLWGVSTPK